MKTPDLERCREQGVPGLEAKPIVDIMAPVVDLASSRAAIEHRNDREAYTEAKAPFIRDVLASLKT